MHSSTEDFKSMKSYDVYKCLQMLVLACMALGYLDEPSGSILWIKMQVHYLTCNPRTSVIWCYICSHKVEQKKLLLFDARDDALDFPFTVCQIVFWGLFNLGPLTLPKFF